MPKCHELQRLPRASKQLKSLNFKKTTPGTTTAPLGLGFVDPAHPAAQPHALKPRTFYDARVLHIRAMPKALLRKPQRLWVDIPPLARKKAAGQVDVSIQKVMSTAALPTAVIRSKISTKLKTAMSLIVTRGADVERDAKGGEKIVFREADAGRHWILHDWTYVVRPSLDIYRMSYHTLIPILRDALTQVRLRAEQADEVWAGRRVHSRTSAPMRSYTKPSHGSTVESVTSYMADLGDPLMAKPTVSDAQKVNSRDPIARLPLHDVPRRSPKSRNQFPSQSNYGSDASNPLARRQQERGNDAVSSVDGSRDQKNLPAVTMHKKKPVSGERRETRERPINRSVSTSNYKGRSPKE